MAEFNCQCGKVLDNSRFGDALYIFLEATNKDPEQEEKGMLVLHAENVFKDGDQLNAEYIEGEMDRYTDASSFVSNYMAGKSGFQKVS